MNDRAAVMARAAAGELLGPLDMRILLGISRSHFHYLHARGDLEVFKVKPPIGTRCFSGLKLTRYLRGEPIDDEAPPAPTPMVWGRKQRRVS